MDPTHRGPEEYGRDNGGFGEEPGRRRPARDQLTPEPGQPTPQARVVRLISGDYLLTVNPIDGSEVELCPPGEQPGPPARRTVTGRADRERATAPPVPPGPPAPQLPLLERAQERERLVRLLSRGRSVRLTGPAGSGRTALLDAVASDCADLAPDGVVRLSGYKRTVTDLLYGLFEAVHDAPLHRPDRDRLLERVRSIGAVVLLDDLEFGGAALEELLDATPECAFLFATVPDVAAPTTDSHLEEVFLAGLGRSAAVDLLERSVERPLTEEEANWAGDLWFESEGLPLRFVQAGALLRQRDMLRTDPEAYGVFGGDGLPADAPFGHDQAVDGVHIPLPSLGEGAAPAALLASRLSGPARDTLRFAVALGGEVPHQAHLPALIGDTHADAALGELAGCGLLSPAGSRYRLAAGVVTQLEAAGYGEDTTERARTAAQHYAWWAGHPSVTPERVTSEGDAVIAAMAQLVPGDGAGQTSVAVLLARSATPAFAAGLHWGAWEKALRIGQEAARIAGEVAEEAYFHHELGVLALLAGNPDRARAELETSIGMRGALADKSGAVAGRRALALVADRSDGPLPVILTPPGDELPVPKAEEPATPPAGTKPSVTQTLSKPYEGATAVISRQSAPGAGRETRQGRFALLAGARRNLVATAAGVLLTGVLGTVVALGLTSGDDDVHGNQDVTTEQSQSQDGGEDGAPADDPADGPADGSTPADTASGGSSATPGPSGSEITPSGSGTPSTGPTEPSDTPSSGTSSSNRPSNKPTKSPTSTKSPSPTKTPSPTGSPTDTGSPSPSDTATEPEPSSPDTSDSASGPSSSSAASADSGPTAA
ncbi:MULTISPECIES: ATP-binding protein [unclassified Streptomyces]|uniref:ATP-binding protein n=1 Tax=unclassified Streptomyces TaxID=2593676 RepID=UPI00325365C3